jgi:hypothetical protein
MEEATTGLYAAELAFAALTQAEPLQAGAAMSSELLKGGFLVIHDRGALYDEVRARCPTCETWRSSHGTSGGPNFRCPLGGSRAAVLVGCVGALRPRCAFESCARRPGEPYVAWRMSRTTAAAAAWQPEVRCTWLQLERSSMSDAAAALAHAWDYLQFAVTRANVGPMGASRHTEKGRRLHLYVNSDKWRAWLRYDEPPVKEHAQPVLGGRSAAQGGLKRSTETT